MARTKIKMAFLSGLLFCLASWSLVLSGPAFFEKRSDKKSTVIFEEATSPTLMSSTLTDDIMTGTTTAVNQQKTNSITTEIPPGDPTTSLIYPTTQGMRPTSESNCRQRVWFVPQERNDLPYDKIKSNCAYLASANGASNGYPAFFNTEEEFEEYKLLNPTRRKEYIGI